MIHAAALPQPPTPPYYDCGCADYHYIATTSVDDVIAGDADATDIATTTTTYCLQLTTYCLLIAAYCLAAYCLRPIAYDRRPTTHVVGLDEYSRMITSRATCRVSQYTCRSSARATPPMPHNAHCCGCDYVCVCERGTSGGATSGVFILMVAAMAAIFWRRQ